MVDLVIVGGGRLGEALLGGLVAAGWAEPGRLAVVDPDAQRREALAAAHPGVVIEAQPMRADGAVIAVKPPVVPEATADAVAAGARRVLSVAAGVRLATLERAASSTGEIGIPVVRAMPNTPALVRRGAAAISGGTDAGPDDVAWARSVLAAVGEVVEVPEPKLDAVTGLSGSGPAYVFLVAESLIEAGVLAGLDRSTADRLTRATLLGAASLLAEGGEDPASLRAAVTSPGGTTASGLRVLEESGVRSTFLDAVAAAAERAGELGS